MKFKGLAALPDANQQKQTLGFTFSAWITTPEWEQIWKKQEAALHRQCPKRMQAYFMIVIFFPDEISTAVTDPAVAAEHFLW